MMMTFVNMNAPGITILPTHPRRLRSQNVLRRLPRPRPSPYFEVETLDEPDPAILARVDGVAFLAVTRDSTCLLKAKPEAVRARLKDLQPAISDRQASLDVVQLHTIVLEDLLHLSHQSIADLENIRYLRDAAEAVAQVRSGKADIAFLIKPVTLDQLHDISLSGDVMPQKSTDFYPKLLSGLAIYALD